jgi:hypothetical protein
VLDTSDHRSPDAAAPLLIWLAAGWGFAIVAQLVHVDWLLPVANPCPDGGPDPGWALPAGSADGGVVWLLLGAGITAACCSRSGPWGLAPVPIAGTAFSVLGSDQRVRVGGTCALPRPTLADGAVVGRRSPCRRLIRVVRSCAGDDLGRFALLMTGEDNSRHFGDFDTMRPPRWLSVLAVAVGDAKRPSRMESYPQGFAISRPPCWMVSFGPPARPPTSPPRSTHYVGFTIAAYVLLALTVMWGARWIAGPLVSSWRVLPIVAVLTGVFCFRRVPGIGDQRLSQRGIRSRAGGRADGRPRPPPRPGQTTGRTAQPAGWWRSGSPTSCSCPRPVWPSSDGW